MKIYCNSCKNINFGNALSTQQEKKYEKLMSDLKQLQSNEAGMRVAKIYVPSIPSSEEKDTGIGKPTSNEAIRMYELMRIYGGATAIKFMPMGQLTDKQPYNSGHYAGAYQRSSFSIGEDIIDLFQLASPKYGNILPLEEANKIVNQHNKNGNSQNVDFETELGWQNQENYPINNALKIAFDNFKNCEFPNKELQQLRTEFEQFKTQKEPIDYDDIYTRLALFPFIKNQEEYKDFFVGFDSNPKIKAQKMPQYEALKQEYKDEIEFYKFKQFLSHKALTESKELINSQNMDLAGDFVMSFSWPEEQMFPDAFMPNSKEGKTAIVGCGMRALNFYDLINKKNSPAHNLLEAKLTHFLTHYDSIRLDVGWAYIDPSYHWGDSKRTHIPVGTEITDFIANVAKKVKGEDFDTRKIMYECDAISHAFDIEKQADKINSLQGTVILSTEEERNDSQNRGWGSHAFFKYNVGLSDDRVVLGTNNHDKEGVLRSAKNYKKSSEHAGALQRVFNKRAQDGYSEGWKLFKDDSDENEHLRKYIRARFAEIELAKHSFIQYTDLFGRMEKVDYHTRGNNQDYKFRLERNYEENYHRALQDNVGYNAADAKSFAMEMTGASAQHFDLYQKALKYSAYLKHKGGIYTREQADNSKYANLDIEKMSLEEINNL